MTKNRETPEPVQTDQALLKDIKTLLEDVKCLVGAIYCMEARFNKDETQSFLKGLGCQAKDESEP